jgi:hypothetical protein
VSGCCPSGFVAATIPTSTPSGGEGFVRSIRWVDLRIGPGGDGTEAEPYDTVAVGIAAIPTGGTLMVVGGDASAASAISLGSKSATIIGLSGQGDDGGRTVVLPLLEYEIDTGTQELAFRNVSLVLTHTGADESLTELHFDHCPSVSLLADGDEPVVHWVGDDDCTFSGSGGAAHFEGGTIGGYVANGSNAVAIARANITGNVTSSVSISISGYSGFGAGVTLTAPIITIDPVSYYAAVAAGVTFAPDPPVVRASFLGATPGYVLTAQADGTWEGASGGGGFSLPGGGKSGQVLESDGAGGAVWATDDTGSSISISTDTLMGRDTAGTGNFEEIGVGGGIEFTGSQTIRVGAFTGDVTKTAGGTSLTIASNAVTDSKLRDSAAYSVIGRAAGTSGDPADIVAGTNTVLGRDGSSNLAFGQVQTGQIADGAVTPAKLGNISTDRLLGRDTPSTGAIEELTVGGGIQFTTLGGIETSAFTGDVTKAAGGTALSIAANAVLNTHIRDSAGLSVIGRSANSTGDPADITAANDNEVLRRSGTSIGFGTVALAGIQTIATDRLLGRDTAGTGVVEQLTVGGGIEFTGTGIQTSAFTGDVTKSAGGTSLTIPNDTVTYAKMQNVSATSRILGRITSGAGDVEELTGAQATSLLTVFTDLVQGVVPASGGGATRWLDSNGMWGDPPGVPGGSTTQIQYNNGGSFDGASGITVVGSETGLALTGYVQIGSTAATANGLVRTGHNVIALAFRNQAGTQDVRAISLGAFVNDAIYIGSTSGDAGKVSNIYAGVHTGGAFEIQVNSATEYTFSASALNLNSNQLLDPLYIRFPGTGTASIASGLNKVPHGAEIIVGRNSTNDGDRVILTYGSDANSLIVGSTTAGASAVANMDFQVATGGNFEFKVNNVTEYTFDASGANFGGNYLAFTGGASAGTVRMASDTALTFRNNAGSADILGVYKDATDALRFGQKTGAWVAPSNMGFDVATGGTFVYFVNAVALATLSATGIDATTVASTGTVGSAFTWRDAAHTGLTASTERSGVIFSLAQTRQWATGAITSQRDMRIVAGTNSFVGASAIGMAATLAISGAPNAGTNATHTNSAALWLESGALAFGSNTGRLGLVRVAHGVEIIVGRNSANSDDCVLMTYGSGTNELFLGATTSGGKAVANMDFYVATGGNFEFKVNNTTEYTFDATTANFGTNSLEFLYGGQIGFYRSGNGSLAGTIKAGVVSSGIAYDAGAGDTHNLRVNGTNYLVVDASEVGVFNAPLSLNGQPIHSAMYLDLSSVSSPSNPSGGKWRVYSDSGGNLLARNNAGTVRTLAIA